jgi:hypothetical protein
VKYIQDEISIILHILTDQRQVLLNANKELKGLKGPKYNENIFLSYRQRIENNVRDFGKLNGKAKEIYDSVSLTQFRRRSCFCFLTFDL